MATGTFAALWLGLVIGWITDRALPRTRNARALSEISSVIAAIGGAGVTALFQDDRVFGYYGIGLAVGFFLHLAIRVKSVSGQQVAEFIGSGDREESMGSRGGKLLPALAQVLSFRLPPVQPDEPTRTGMDFPTAPAEPEPAPLGAVAGSAKDLLDDAGIDVNAARNIEPAERGATRAFIWEEGTSGVGVAGIEEDYDEDSGSVPVPEESAADDEGPLEVASRGIGARDFEADEIDLERDAKAADEAGGDARHLNVCLTRDRHPLPAATELGAGLEYELRLDIGHLAPESVVQNARQHPFPAELLPEDEHGHWLEIIVASNEFLIDAGQAPSSADWQILSPSQGGLAVRHLFVPNTGASWVCDCPYGESHTCDASDRRSHLFILLAAPGKPGMARLRIAVYFEKNLVQSQLLTAVVAIDQREGAGYSSWIDYSLTAAIGKVEQFQARNLNILTNDNADGTHRVVINGGKHALAFNLTEGQIAAALGAVRQALYDIHIEINGGKRNRFDANNSKSPAECRSDLTRLASAGWQLWNAVFTYQGQQGFDLRTNVLKERAWVQISRVRHSLFVFPWALVYDIPLETGGPYTYCPGIELTDQPEQPASEWKSCPFQAGHGLNTICPFGFWGIKHNIEQPPSMPDGVSLAGEIPLTREPKMIVGESSDLDQGLRQKHLAAIRSGLEGFRLDSFLDRAKLAKALANRAIEMIYFYCHGTGVRLATSDTTVTGLVVGADQIVTGADIMAWRQAVWPPPTQPHWDQTRPLVFLNGCHTADVTTQSLSNLVDAFVDARAAGVIGTEITLNQRVANEAAEQFFDFFRKRNSVGESLRRMRIHLLKKGNTLGLVYTPYCAANLQLV